MTPIEQLTIQQSPAATDHDGDQKQPRKISPERQARILLRQVDSVLKTEGVEAAIERLQMVRQAIPSTDSTRCWIQDYQDMLETWQNGLALEVLDEFNEFGFRRACDLAYRSIGWIEDERLWPYFRTCERVLGQMGKRKQLAASDEGWEDDGSEPEMPSLDEASEEDLD